MSDIAHTNDKNDGAWDFRLIFAVTYVTLLMVITLGRLISAMRPNTGAGRSAPRRSIFREARVATYSALPFAFKG
jgi:hypothetical protein